MNILYMACFALYAARRWMDEPSSEQMEVVPWN